MPSILTSLKFAFEMTMGFGLHVCLCTAFMSGIHAGQKGVRSFGMGVRSGYEPSCGFWVLHKNGRPGLCGALPQTFIP